MGLGTRRKDYVNLGLSLQKNGETIRFVTTDSRRLVLTEGYWTVFADNIPPRILQELESGMVLPISVFEILSGILAAVTKNALVTCAYSKAAHSEGITWIVFEDNLVFRVTGLFRKEFPTYQCFTDKTKAFEMEFSTEELTMALKRIKSLADFFQVTVFNCNSEKKYIDIEAIRGPTTFSKEPVSYDNQRGSLAQDLVMGANISFTIDALSRIPSEKVLMEVDGSFQPIRFTPIFEQGKKDSLKTNIQIVMPINLAVTFTQ